ncbi:hypothetical protein MPLSOD_80052 [Mesorhizobium sp. SOD10]|nr:hypothetical protein MPLSOD_80052 [Mesorhizobium sp. SOD10]
MIALAAKAEPPRASKAMAVTTDFHIAIPVFHTPPLFKFARHSRPLHRSLYEMLPEPQLNAAFMPQSVWDGLSMPIRPASPEY